MVRPATDRSSGNVDIGPAEAARLVVDEIEPHLAGLPDAQRHADVVGVDDTLDGFTDRFEQRPMVEM